MDPTDEQAGAWTEAFESGKFIRKSSEFREHIAKGELFDVEAGRYHLYISHACPGRIAPSLLENYSDLRITFQWMSWIGE